MLEPYSCSCCSPPCICRGRDISVSHHTTHHVAVTVVAVSLSLRLSVLVRLGPGLCFCVNVRPPSRRLGDKVFFARLCFCVNSGAAPDATGFGFRVVNFAAAIPTLFLAHKPLKMFTGPHGEVSRMGSPGYSLAVLVWAGVPPILLLPIRQPGPALEDLSTG